MTNMKLVLSPTARAALVALYELGSDDRPADAGRVARRLGISPSAAARALLELDGLGLVWAERCRLTMQGLAKASRLSAQRTTRHRAA